jgi:hypothetical protein
MTTRLSLGKSIPAIRAIRYLRTRLDIAGAFLVLPLTLFMPRIGADDAHHAFPADDLALFATRLD